MAAASLCVNVNANEEDFTDPEYFVYFSFRGNYQGIESVYIEVSYKNNDFTYTMPGPDVLKGYEPDVYPDCAFKYWNTEPDGSGITLYEGDVINDFSETDIMFYAIWDTGEDEVNYGTLFWDNWLEFNGNGVKGGDTVHIYGQLEYPYDNDDFTYTMPGTDVLRRYEPEDYPGYTFKCWNTEPDGSGITLYEGDVLDGFGETGTKFYAIWDIAETIENADIDSNTNQENVGLSSLNMLYIGAACIIAAAVGATIIIVVVTKKKRNKNN